MPNPVLAGLVTNPEQLSRVNQTAKPIAQKQTAREDAFASLLASKLQAQPASPAEVSATLPADKRRVRQALDLDWSGGQTATGGDAILTGITKLRGVFDRQQSRLQSAMAAQTTDYRNILQVQAELVNFTVLVDVTSKLTGKATQTSEALLKG